MTNARLNQTVFFLDNEKNLMGVGVLVAPRWIATCSHVVAAYLDNPMMCYEEDKPDVTISCHLYDSNVRNLTGSIEYWNPMIPADTIPNFIPATHDLTLIKIDDSLEDVKTKRGAAQFVYGSETNLSKDTDVVARGPYLEAGVDIGSMECCKMCFTIIDPQNAFHRLYLQYKSDPSTHIPDLGQSGTPVFDADERKLLGIIDRVNNTNKPHITATAIPISFILNILREKDHSLDLPPSDNHVITFNDELLKKSQSNFSPEVTEIIVNKLEIQKSNGYSQSVLTNYLLSTGALPYVMGELQNQRLSFLNESDDISPPKTPLTTTIDVFRKFALQLLLDTDVLMFKGLHQIYPSAASEIQCLSEDIKKIYYDCYQNLSEDVKARDHVFCQAVTDKINIWRKEFFNRSNEYGYDKIFFEIKTMSSPILLRRLNDLNKMYIRESSFPSTDAQREFDKLIDSNGNATKNIFGDNFSLTKFKKWWLSPLEGHFLQTSLSGNENEQEELKELATSTMKFLKLVGDTILLHWAIERFKLCERFDTVELKRSEYDTIIELMHFELKDLVIYSDFFLQLLFNASRTMLGDT